MYEIYRVCSELASIFLPRQLALALREAPGLAGSGRVHPVRMVREIPGFNAA